MMFMIKIAIFSTLTYLCVNVNGVIVRSQLPRWEDKRTVPDQIHLSWDGNSSHMTVTWNTEVSTDSVVLYGMCSEHLNLTTNGSQTKFVDFGINRRTQYVHRALMTGLVETSTYFYKVGNGGDWSDVYSFRSLQSGTNWSPRLAVFGDMGLENARSIHRLRGLVKRREIDMIIHVGDFGYDLNNDEGRVGDAFMRMLQPIAAYVPYQTVVGNHENSRNFTQYKNRFSMPGYENGLFYRFTLGAATFLVFSTEFYFFVEFGFWQIPRQYSWLESQLKELSNFVNRQDIPWIITLGHRPMYCSNDDRDDCTKHESIIRTGIPVLHEWALEKLFYRYGVDLCIWAHEHSYERLFPVYDRKVCNGTDSENPYHNPGAPVHVISGSAGCKEKTDNFVNPEPWSAFRNNDYGFMKMHILNKTHIAVKQVSDEKGGTVIDSMLLVKDRYGVYGRKIQNKCYKTPNNI